MYAYQTGLEGTSGKLVVEHDKVVEQLQDRHHDLWIGGLRLERLGDGRHGAGHQSTLKQHEGSLVCRVPSRYQRIDRGTLSRSSIPDERVSMAYGASNSLMHW